jgi:hypothetical protein
MKLFCEYFPRRNKLPRHIRTNTTTRASFQSLLSPLLMAPRMINHLSHPVIFLGTHFSLVVLLVFYFVFPICSHYSCLSFRICFPISLLELLLRNSFRPSRIVYLPPPLYRSSKLAIGSTLCFTTWCLSTSSSPVIIALVCLPPFAQMSSRS